MATKRTGKPVGRPTPFPYSAELADEICFRMINGRHLASICEDDDMPGRYSVYRWMAAKPEFARQLSIARELLGDHYAGKILDAVENITSRQDVVLASLKTRSWMWAASKYAPMQYSDRVVGQIHANQSAAQPSTSPQPVDLSHMTVEEKVSLRRLLEKARSTIALIED